MAVLLLLASLAVAQSTPPVDSCRANVKQWMSEMGKRRIRLRELVRRKSFLVSCLADAQQPYHDWYWSIAQDYEWDWTIRVEIFLSRHPEIQEQFEAEDISIGIRR